MTEPHDRERLDRLTVRIAEGRDSAGELAEFRRLASVDPGAWEALAELQRDDRELRGLALAATAPALDAPLPFPRGNPPRPRFAAAVGWLVATALGIALASGGALRPPDGRVQVASLAPDLSSAAALENYLDRGRAEGRVLHEIEPKALVGSRPLAGGGYELVFVRQILERVEVPEVWRLDARLDGAADGAAVPVPATLPPSIHQAF
jgi:hypothetical protein